MQPNRHIAYSDLAASYAHLDRLEDAADAVSKYRASTPDISRARIESLYPFRQATHRKRYLALSARPDCRCERPLSL